MKEEVKEEVMTGQILRVWLDEVTPNRIHFLVVRRNGRTRRGYATKGSPLYDLLARRQPSPVDLAIGRG